MADCLAMVAARGIERRCAGPGAQPHPLKTRVAPIASKPAPTGFAKLTTQDADRAIVGADLLAMQAPQMGLTDSTSNHQRAAHPSGLNTRTPDGGLFASLLVGLRGRTINSPPQLGQSPPNFCSVQVAQKVHSNEQIRACAESGGRSQSQHSQFGRNSSMSTSLMAGNFHLYI